VLIRLADGLGLIRNRRLSNSGVKVFSPYQYEPATQRHIETYDEPKSAMNKKLKFRLHTNFAAACFLILIAGSSIESTAGNHRTTYLLTRLEQVHEKPENPPVRPGQPYNQGTWPLP
jgi:hypothetical protein